MAFKFVSFKIPQEKLAEIKRFHTESMRLKYGAKPTIRTADGEKKYLRTEVEDEQGNWGDRDYSIRDGYWVIHEGEYHHVYN